MTTTNILGALSVETIASARQTHGSSVAESLLVHDLQRMLERLDGAGLAPEQCAELLRACRATAALGWTAADGVTA